MVDGAPQENRAEMTSEDSGIQTHYIDALGRRHESSPAALAAIRRAMESGGSAAAAKPRTAPAQGAAAGGLRGRARRQASNAGEGVIVVSEGESAETGPGELELEDGATITLDDRLPADLPVGYHRLHRRGGTAARLIVAPETCFLPESFRIWGWAIQLYAARSRRSWGIGDLADLRRLGTWAARAGAGIALINPLAAASPLSPQQPSPYFPSSRRFRSPLYLRIEEVDGADTLRDLSAIAARARALNTDRRIDRDEVFRLKMGALEQIWATVGRRELPPLDAFIAEQGAGLGEFATFCALAERFQSGWHGWPEDLRHPASAAVRAIAGKGGLADRIRFHQWLQLQIDRQLARASRVVPVMQDLPIGFDADGADAWAFQDVLADGISVGAPPDEFNTKGQNWGLPPFVPAKLRAAGYQPFIDTIRGCVRHSGGLRIDHVMGLFRLFWIPNGMEPKDGAYVRSHARDLLAIVAIESQRARAVIVGEDLGTVEEDTRAELMRRKVLSYRLLWFEKGSPAKYPEQALAAVTTHDLPTIAGLWTGSDVAAQKELGMAPNEKGTREILNRVRRLTRARAGTPLPAAITRVHEALALAPSRIITATLDDAMQVEERPNMPATTNEWPNWSIALPQPIESLDKNATAARIGRILSRGRTGRKRPRRR
ncbi:MAG: 4-alpha-glucanotransferase [Acidobacteriota bacterium]